MELEGTLWKFDRYLVPSTSVYECELKTVYWAFIQSLFEFILWLYDFFSHTENYCIFWISLNIYDGTRKSALDTNMLHFFYHINKYTVFCEILYHIIIN